MANKRRDLIDRSALFEAVSSVTMVITGLRFGKDVLREFMTKFRKKVLQIVDEQPTVDAVPRAVYDKAIAERNAMVALADSYKTEIPQWILVTERLPEENVHILTVDDEDWVEIDSLGSEGFRSYRNVTHWMPLPEPPKET